MQEVDFSSLIFLEPAASRQGWRTVKHCRPAGARSASSADDDGNALDQLLKARLINAKVTKVKDGNEASRCSRKERSTRSRATRSSSSVSPCRRRIRRRCDLGEDLRSSRSRSAAARRFGVPAGSQPALTQIYVAASSSRSSGVARTDRASVRDPRSDVSAQCNTAIGA
jgi:hypothetical protein